MKKLTAVLLAGLCGMVLMGCQPVNTNFTGTPGEVKLVTLDPGHFHAALLQKRMYDQVSPNVPVYAPDSPDVIDHLYRIEGFNTRAEDPTVWQETMYAGPDFLEKMIADRAGDVVVISGNNSKKIDYVDRCINAGFNVLADTPMVISPEQFPLLVKAFKDAQWRGLLLYDIMPERHEITTLLQKEFSQIEPVFGHLQKGTLENPAVIQESVHHFFQYVAGNPIKRPAWFFDPAQQGEGLVNVSAHLVDLVQWACFPEQIILYKTDIKMLDAKRWATLMTPEQFNEVTHLESYPDTLADYVKDDQLAVYSNGEMNYTIKGIHAKVSVTWNYQAPEGTGDTHYSIMRGTRCNLVIRQGAEENYEPVLYVEAVPGAHIDNVIHRAVYKTLQENYPGITMEKLAAGKWKINVPQQYNVGHEAHFSQVMEKYLSYLKEGKLPQWEVPNMIAKYYTTTEALKATKQE